MPRRHSASPAAATSTATTAAVATNAGGGGTSRGHVNNDSRLLRDLEDDCVDRDIYDEEIRSRQNHDPTYVDCLSLCSFTSSAAHI